MDALQEAYNEKEAAAEARAETARALADAEQALAAAEKTLAGAGVLADAAAAAADARAAQNAAAQALAEARADQQRLSTLMDALADAERALTEARKAYDEAYQNYLDSNTGFTSAGEGARDTDENLAALDAAAQALQDAESAVRQIEEEIGSNTVEGAEKAVSDASDAFDRAKGDAMAAEEALAQKVSELGGIGEDATGTGAVRDEDAKDGDAAIRVSGDVGIVSGGGVTGTDDGALTIDTDGNLNIQAEGDVNIQSSQDVNVDDITSGGDVAVTANGDITGTGDDPSITGDKVTLNAISTGDETSTIGKDDGTPLNVDADELGLRGDEVDVKVNGDVTLDDVVADKADIQVGGDVRQKDGTQVDIGDLDIRADGDIGSKDDPIDMNVDEITAIGDNVYIDNKSDELLVDEITGHEVVIDTDGSINTKPDGMITADDLTIDAVDDIGAQDQPIRVTVRDKLDLNSLRGGIWFKNFFKRSSGSGNAKKDGWTLLVDPETQISVYGRFAPGARLEVTNTNHYAQLMVPDQMKDIVACDCEDLMNYSQECAAEASAEALRILAENSDSAVCRQLWKLIGDGDALYDFVLGIFAPTQPVCTSRMYFMIDFSELDSTYDGALEGQTLYLMLCVEGEMVCVQTFVEDSCVYFVLEKLGMEKPDFSFTQFAIVDEAAFTRMVEAGEIPAGCLIDSLGRKVDFEANVVEKD